MPKNTYRHVSFYLYEDIKTVKSTLAYCDKALNNAITELIKKKEFIAKLNKTLILQLTEKSPPNASCWWGWEQKDVTLDKIRQAAGTTTGIARDIGIKEVTSAMDSILSEWYPAYTEGCLLSLQVSKIQKCSSRREERAKITYTPFVG